MIKSFERMRGGEIFVPKIPSMRILDLARAIGPHCQTKVVGIRPGEKLHEVMISSDDARHTKELDDCYVIQPAFHWWRSENHSTGRPVPESFTYSSDTNAEWLTIPQLEKLLKE